MIKNFKKFNEERKYDFSHPDAPDTWSVHVPDDRPQQYDKVTCINNDKFEGKLTVDKPYQILGFSSMGDMYFMEDDTKRYNHYPIKCFSDTPKEPLRGTTVNESNTISKEIIESIEEHDETLTTKRMNHYMKREYDSKKHTAGYIITTNKKTVKLLIEDEQDCCEDWGYFMSEDDTEEFIGAELINIEIVDDGLKSSELKLDKVDDDNARDDGRSTQTMFVNVNTSKGLLQFTAYNNHNGYYGHTAYFMINDKIETEKSL